MVNRYGKLTFAAVKAELSNRGMTISKDTVGSGTGSGEYRVTFKLGPWLNMTTKKAEDAAFYASDLDDAFRTGVKMSMDYSARHGMPHVK